MSLLIVKQKIADYQCPCIQYLDEAGSIAYLLNQIIAVKRRSMLEYFPLNWYLYPIDLSLIHEHDECS